MMIASFQANLMSIHADTAEISTQWTDGFSALYSRCTNYVTIKFAFVVFCKIKNVKIAKCRDFFRQSINSFPIYQIDPQLTHRFACSYITKHTTMHCQI